MKGKTYVHRKIYAKHRLQWLDLLAKCHLPAITNTFTKYILYTLDRIFGEKFSIFK